MRPRAGKPWTTVDDALLRERYPKEGPSEALGAALGRSPQAIRVRAKRIKVRHCRFFSTDTLEDIRAQCVIEGECWIWQRHVGKWGPRIWIRRGKPGSGHRPVNVRPHAYRLATGRARRSDYVVRGGCGHPLCVNPEHALVQTRSEFYAETTAGMQSAGARMKRAQAMRTRHAKLTPEDVAAIRAAQHSGETGEAIAARFGITGSSVREIWQGLLWRDVGNPFAQLLP